MELLLKAGADLTPATQFSWMARAPLDWARSRQDADGPRIVKLLEVALEEHEGMTADDTVSSNPAESR